MAKKIMLCRCEDVSVGAVAEHANWRDAKLHTRCGMGPCQGRICGAAAACGYGDAFHFSRLFRAAIGTPPSIYRRTVLAAARFA